MEYIKVENHKVTELVSTVNDTEFEKAEGWVRVDCSCGVCVGDDVRMWDKNWKLRPLQELVEEGFVELAKASKGDLLPEGTVLEKVEDNQIVLKTNYDFAKEGFIELATLEYLDDGSREIKSGTIEELLGLGKITQEKVDKIRAVEVREERDIKLLELDSIVLNPLRWSSLTEGQQQVLGIYRQELLDVPQQEGFPTNIQWPIKPE